MGKCHVKAVEGEAKRRQDIFIVKHLPAGASAQELRERFARCGELVRCSVAPSGTVAIVQYAENAHAKHAFQKLAFSKYKHAPLYLEWAPEDVFVDGAVPPHWWLVRTSKMKQLMLRMRRAAKALRRSLSRT